jgi:hypothetical protein
MYRCTVCVHELVGAQAGARFIGGNRISANLLNDDIVDGDPALPQKHPKPLASDRAVEALPCGPCDCP